MRRPIAIEDLARAFLAKARLIGVDLGAKTIGLAISDVERRLASPLKTLPRGAFHKRRRGADRDLRRIRDRRESSSGCRSIWRARQSARPIDARFRPQSIDADRSADRLWDERFSTAAVTRSLIANDVSRARRAKSSTRWRPLISCRARWTGWRPGAPKIGRS